MPITRLIVRLAIFSITFSLLVVLIGFILGKTALFPYVGELLYIARERWINSPGPVEVLRVYTIDIQRGLVVATGQTSSYYNGILKSGEFIFPKVIPIPYILNSSSLTVLGLRGGTWSPDFSHLAVFIGTDSGVYVALGNSNENTFQRVSAVFNEIHMDWTADNRLLIVGITSSQSQVYVVDTNASKFEIYTIISDSSTYQINSGDWQLDGRRIRLRAYFFGNYPGTLILDANTGDHLIRIPTGYILEWSPDGNQIAYQDTFSPNFQNEVCIVNINDTHSRCIQLPSQLWASVAWLP